jgi:hypothetical protein
VAAAVAGILYGSSGALYAQEQPPGAVAAPAAESNPLQEVVVTATAEGVKKLDASYNIVSVDLTQIRQANPKSVADLLKQSPGVWSESSGGQTGANIEVAGFPSGGDAPFFTNMVEGLPMYGMPSLSFMDSSSLFRLDNTIDRVELVQGGPSAVFGSGQMGETSNFLLRRGTATPTGQFSGTYGDEGLWRADAFYGGPIADDWFGSIGGFYRTSKGVRAPQFPADQGGQFTATISHNLDGGSLLFWGRVLDDKNQFIVPIPVIESQSGNFSAYPGFNPLTSSYGSYAIQNVTLPNPAGGFEGANLANGRGTQFYYFGAKWDQKIAGWHFLNNFMADGGELDTNALFSGPNPRPLSYYLYGCQLPQAPGYCNGATAVDTNSNLGPGGQGLPLFYNINAIYANSGQPVPLSQSVIQQGWWFIQKSLRNIVDELRISREVFAGNTLTGGVYLTHYTDNDNWSLGNQMLMTNTPNATPIALNYRLNGHTYNLTSPQGFVNFNGNYNILEHGDATNVAGYLSDSWKSGPWLVDAGLRVEKIDANQRTCNRTNTQLGSIYDLYENAVPLCNGTWDYEHYTRTMPTWTGGINYEFTDHMSAYLRINNGVHFDDFDNNIRGASGNFAPLETIRNYEAGFKFQNQFAYLDIIYFQRNFTGLQYQPATPSGTPIGGPSIYGAHTHGLEFNGTLSPFSGVSGLEGFNVLLLGDWVDGHYTDNINCQKYTDILGNPQCGYINGAPLQRQPKERIAVTPEYSAPGPWGSVTLWATYEYVGQRYEDIAGLAPLGTYYMLNAGIKSQLTQNWSLWVQGTNLTNQIGLTEGNARIFGQAVGLGGVLLARPIEGREINLTAEYKF